MEAPFLFPPLVIMETYTEVEPPLVWILSIYNKQVSYNNINDKCVCMCVGGEQISEVCRIA